MEREIVMELLEARRAVEAAYRRAEEAWGSIGKGEALPQALQIADRIQLGEALRVERPGDMSIERTLLVLRAMLARAREDPGDRRRCADYLEAQERFLVAEARYLACVREAREIHGLTEPEIRRAKLVGARMRSDLGPRSGGPRAGLEGVG